MAKTHRKALYRDLVSSPLVRAVEAATTDADRAAAINTLIAVCRAGNLAASPIYSREIIPIGSPMEKWMVEFKRHSTIPAELAFWVPLQLIGHYLMLKGARVDLAPARSGALKYLYTNTYVLHCGDHGVGKGVVEDLTWESLGVSCDRVGRIGSQEAFLLELQAHDGKPLIQSLDEWPIFWLALKTDPSQGEMLTAYLRAFRQQRCELKYKSAHYKCETPLLTVMGFAQPKRLFDVLQPEDYSCGFVRRHLITFSPSVKLTMADQHKYDMQVVADDLAKAGVVQRWREHVATTPLHRDYTIDSGATDYMRWHVLKAGIDLGLEAGYITTALYTARKFALIYHYLLGETGAIIGRTAVEHAVALTKLTLHDLQYLMDEGRRSAVSKLLEEAIQLRKDIESGAKKGRFDARRLMQNLHFEDVQTAHLIYKIAAAADLSDDSTTKVVEMSRADEFLTRFG